ncbi:MULTISPECIES: hypothetical protein [Pseudomonas]|uniref:hypothetical protein n=1 Tax=Pseudomonas TaxID=286 RepID=UPI00234DC274|nr:hypothetical protein [Pseudomonas sp. BLCC-B112]MDC7817481.1 hypothetical protein [Pseudomonas sp. BLCC-B112]
MSDEITSDELGLLLDNIRLEIRADHQAGSEVTSMKLKPNEVSVVDLIEENLAVEGRTFRFDADSSKLTIDSSNCPPPEH